MLGLASSAMLKAGKGSTGMKLAVWIATLLLTVGLVAACGDDDDDVQDPAEDLATQIEDAEFDISEELGNLSDDLQERFDDLDLANAPETVKDEINDACQQLTEEAEDESLASELTDVCGDIRTALAEGSQEALNAAQDRLEDLLEQ